MRKLLLFSALCFGVSAAAHADTTFYLINNTYGTVSPDGSSIAVNGAATGSLAINTNSGLVDSMNVTVTEGGSTYTFTGAPYDQGSLGNNLQYQEYSYDASGDILLFVLPVNTLKGYAGGNLCTFNFACPDGQPDGLFNAGYFGMVDSTTGVETDYSAATGALAQTPEPSSVILLGTGVLGAAGAMRRRWLARSA